MNFQKPYLYFAAPLFSMAELDFNLKIVETLEAFFTIFLPQRDGGLMRKKISAGENPTYAAMDVFKYDIQAMQKCDLLLAVLDGRSVDEGVAFEIGFSFAIGKECFGFKTDDRILLPSGNNPMVEQPLKQLFYNTDDLFSWARTYDRKTSYTSTEAKPQPKMI